MKPRGDAVNKSLSIGVRETVVEDIPGDWE